MEYTPSLAHAFTSQIQVLSFQFCKDFEKLLEESNKLCCKIIFVFNVWFALREPCSDWLFNKENT